MEYRRRKKEDEIVFKVHFISVKKVLGNLILINADILVVVLEQRRRRLNIINIIGAQLGVYLYLSMNTPDRIRSQ